MTNQATILFVLISAMIPALASAANKTVTVVVLGEKESAPDGVVPAAGAKIEVVREEGTRSVAFADKSGRAVISYPESRSFVIFVVAGPMRTKRTNRFYGRMDHVVSVFMGAEPAYGPDAFGELQEALTSVAKGAENGLPEALQSQFKGTEVDEELAAAVKAGRASDQEVRECEAALASIRRAPVLRGSATDADPPTRRTFPNIRPGARRDRR